MGYIPADRTIPEIQSTLFETPGEYFCRVAEGLNEMPAFIREMSEDEIWQVLSYLGTLGR